MKLHINAKVQHWEDGVVNGKNDTENGDNIPCKKGDEWCPIIDTETGIIENWEQGKTAEIHYKVCDECSWELYEDHYDHVSIACQYNGYVPDILSPKEPGYGDYIIMNIDENGKIEDWKIDEYEFIDSIGR